MFASVPGAGTFTLTAGRKKWGEALRSRTSPFSLSRLAGEPIPKAEHREVGMAGINRRPG
jgi:hypothetical protein